MDTVGCDELFNGKDCNDMVTSLEQMLNKSIKENVPLKKKYNKKKPKPLIVGK